MKKISIFLSITLVIMLIAVYFVLWPKARFELAVEASGGFPFQIGLTGATVTNCQISCCTPVCSCCTGGTLCTNKTVAQCAMYADVTGTPAGGSGANALFTIMNLGIAGVSSGGSLIAGGSTMTEMDSGVLAGTGGCTGVACTAINDKNIFEKYYEIVKYAITKIKD